MTAPGETLRQGPRGRPHGLLLAAGRGERWGQPKALAHDSDGQSWLRRTVQVLRDGGCDPVTVVLGASADEARSLLGGLSVHVVVADDWAEGLSASLRAGLEALASSSADSALITLVDLPDVGADVVKRVIAASGGGRRALARATYGGRPGHPVMLGRTHWAAVLGTAVADRGARDYLSSSDTTLVECGDLAGGQDVDSR